MSIIMLQYNFILYSHMKFFDLDQNEEYLKLFELLNNIQNFSKILITIFDTLNLFLLP